MLWVRGLVLRGQPKQGLKGGHRRPPSVEPKDEFVEVVREMFGAHAMMGTPEPCLEIREDAMNAGKQPRRIRGHALGFRAVVVAPSPERKVALPAIGQDNAAGRHGVLDERDERHRRHILHGCQANSPGPLASDFNRTDHNGFLAVAPPAATPANLQATHVGLVDFHRSRDAVALGSDHRGSQPLEQRPCGLVAAQPQLALKLRAEMPGVCVETR